VTALFNSVKSKILALLLLAVVTLVATNVIELVTARQNQATQLQDNLEKSTATSSRIINDILQQHVDRLIALANTPTVQGNDWEVAKQYLLAEGRRLLKEDSSLFSMISMSDLNGTAFIADGSSVSITERDYYQAITGGKDLFFSPPKIGKNDGKLSVSVAVPVKKDGRLFRVLFGVIDLDKLSQEVVLMKHGNNGRAFMIDANSICIAHPNKDLLNQDLSKESSTVPAQMAEIIRGIPATKAGKAEYSFMGVDSILHYQQVPVTGWFLALVADCNEVFGTINTLTRNITIIIVITSLLLLALGWFMTGKTIRPINELVAATNRLAKGDLITEISVNTQDEIGNLARSFEGMRRDLQAVIGKTAQASNQVSGTAKALTFQAEQTAAAATNNATTISEISATVEDVVENIKKVSEQAEEASRQAGQGQQSIDMVINTMLVMKQSANEMSTSMSTLNEAVGNVGQFIETINAIAGQTNLLALNAAIEAARAGEAGMGFAVVADEVRKLAESSARSAGEISRIISEVQQQSARTAADMEKSKENVEHGDQVIKEISKSLVTVIKLVQEFNLKAQDVAAAAGQVSSAVQDVAATTEEQTAAMEEVSAAAAELNGIAAEMEEAMKKFKR